jgi:hypothetical protein
MDAGALGPMVEQFTDELIALGHTRFTVSGFDDSVSLSTERDVFSAFSGHGT